MKIADVLTSPQHYQTTGSYLAVQTAAAFPELTISTAYSASIWVQKSAWSVEWDTIMRVSADST